MGHQLRRSVLDSCEDLSMISLCSSCEAAACRQRWGQQRREEEEELLRRRPAPLLVCACGVAAGAGHQRRGRVLHYAVRAEVREGTLHQLAAFHWRLLLPESAHHSATEGQWEVVLLAASLIKASLFYVFSIYFLTPCALKLQLCHFWPQVVCLAVFFALLIKKVDEEDYRNVAIVHIDSPGKSGRGRERNCSGGLFHLSSHHGCSGFNRKKKSNSSLQVVVKTAERPNRLSTSHLLPQTLRR